MCHSTLLCASHKTPDEQALISDPYMSPQGLSSLSATPNPPRWFTSEDTGHLTEVNRIASVTTPELLRSSCLSHTYTSDLCINTPEHLILLSQGCACFSSLDLLFSILSFLLFFFFSFFLMNNLKGSGGEKKNN